MHLTHYIYIYRRTSYERFWEGRKSFSTITSHLRNLSRLIWINVAPQPDDSPSVIAKGKTPEYKITPAQLKKKKSDALILCALFPYTIKHYLRGEDGLMWEDYKGLVPGWFARVVDPGLPGDYGSASFTTDGHISGRTSPDSTTTRVPRRDATKRIRPKRSKQRLLNPETPLIGQTTVDFGMDTAGGSMPLPLM